jgi:O-antigen ligase
MNNGQSNLGESFITWKRLYFIPVIFLVTYNLLQTEKQIKTAMAVMSFVTFTSAIQVLRNNTEFSGAHYSDGFRYGGMFGSGGENDLAAFLAINFFWFLFWSQETSTKWKKLLFLGMAAMVGWACLYCYSRGAYIALTAGLVFYGWRRYRPMLVVLVVMLFTIPAWAPQPVRERIEMLTQDDKLEQDSSAQNRLVIWEGGKQIIAEHALIGVGPNNFSAHIRRYADLPENGPSTSHNMYLRMGAELGVPGLIIFLLLLVCFFKEGFWLSREAKGWQSTWATAFTASIIAVIIVNCFGDRFFREELTGYIWVGAAIAYKLRGMHAHGKSMENSAATVIPLPHSATG